MDTAMLRSLKIFNGMDEKEIKRAAAALGVCERVYKKGEIIFHAGNTTDTMGMVLSGSVIIENNDLWGNRTILGYIGKGQFFGETYALLENTVLLVDACANEDSCIVFFKIGAVRSMAASGEPWLVKLLSNLLAISVRKNIALSERSFHTARKTSRAKLLSYLNFISLKKKSTEFDIPFDRQQLADYLNLERTALSKELGKMQNDGLITFRKNHFVLNKTKSQGK